MNRFLTSLKWAAGTLILICGILWLTLLRQAPQPGAATPLAVYGAVPDFALLTQDGATLSRADLLGTVWVADFIFARCSGQCPMMHGQMHRLQEMFRNVPQVRLLSITVDPTHDTPAQLAILARQLGAVPGRWDLLTGSPQAIRTLMERGFLLGLTEGTDPREPIGHSTKLVLVDAHGIIRSYVDATDADAVARVRQHIQQLYRRESR